MSRALKVLTRLRPEPPVRFLSLAARIAAVRLELAALEQQQRDELKAHVTLVVGSGHCFNARELFAHRLVSPTLAAAFDELGLTSARQLGKKLKQLGLTRVGEDEHGVVWMV